MAQHSKAPKQKYTIMVGPPGTFKQVIISRKYAFDVVREVVRDVQLPGTPIEGEREIHFQSPIFGLVRVRWETIQ